MSNSSVTHTLSAAKYSNCQGSRSISNLHVPTLAYDDTTITLVWQKPENCADISDYAVFQNGRRIGTARESFQRTADWAYTYMQSFYAHYKQQNIHMADVDIHTYKAVNLTPSTSYHFEVVPLDADGCELSSPVSVDWSTTSAPDSFNIADYGAKPVNKGYTFYDDEICRMIESNTRSIQTAIDSCTKGGKVVIPEGIWMSGAIYLHSDMTLELEEGAILFGSPNADHYDQNYLLYPYSTDTRSWALINAYSSDEKMPLRNIRIAGRGTVFGNGWKYGEKDTISGDGSTPFYQELLTGDPADPAYRLKQWVCGTNAKVYSASAPESSYGILAADASMKGQLRGLNAARAYSTRPNLIVIRGAENVYLEGITAENPAFHTIALLDSQNVVSENVKYITYDANNADGIELGNTSNALVYNCFFDTGDDSVNFATGLGKGVSDSNQQPSKNIWTFNNFIRKGHGGAIAAGSHTGAGICNMLVEDNVLNHGDIPFRFKSAPVNGGGVDHVLIRDCAVGNVKQLFVLSTIYNDNNQTLTVEPADKPAEFHDIEAYNITADGIAQNTFYLTADVRYEDLSRPWHTHHDLYFQDITVTGISPELNGRAEILTGIENAVFHNVKLEPNLHPWNHIAYCKNLSFYQCDESESIHNAMSPPEWNKDTSFLKEVPSDTAGTDARVTLEWNGANNSHGLTGYLIETYLPGHADPVDITPPIPPVSADNGNNTFTISGLCHNTNYLFKLYAINAAGNKTEGPCCTIKTAQSSHSNHLNALADPAVTYDGKGYTWAAATFKNAVKSDPRIRGYQFLVNGKPVKKIYNYQLAQSRSADELRLTAGRMLDRKNRVELMAFSDDGQTLSYDVNTIILDKKYNLKAPVWTSGLEVSHDGSTFTLTWKEPESESGIYAYRVYTDGKPVYRHPTDYFNPVNSKYTTKSTSIVLDNIDPSVSHTFKVEAADAWWKSLAGEAPFHWTGSGPEYCYHG